MAKKKTVKANKSNLILLIIALTLAVLSIVSLVFNVFVTEYYMLDKLVTGSYCNGTEFIANLFNGTTISFVGVTSVICYLLALLGCFTFVILTILKIANIKICNKALVITALVTAFVGILFAGFAFALTGRVDDLLGYKVVKAGLCVYFTLISSVGIAITMLLNNNK